MDPYDKGLGGRFCVGKRKGQDHYRCPPGRCAPDGVGVGVEKHGIQPFEDVEVLTHFAFEAALGAFQAGVGDYIAQFEPAMSQIELMEGKVVASLGAEAGQSLIQFTMPAVQQ